MFKPRPVWLTDQERRALRSIAEVLATEDPALAKLLDSTPMRRRHVLRRYPRARLIIIFAVLALVLLAADMILQTNGAMLLLLLPMAIWWFASSRTRER
jgi:hypothetical protein